MALVDFIRKNCPGAMNVAFPPKAPSRDQVPNSSRTTVNHIPHVHARMDTISTLPSYADAAATSAAEYEDFDILAFTESWLNNSNQGDSVRLLNFCDPFRKDRGPHKSGGGVIVYVKDSINAVRRSDLELHDLEAVWIQLCLNGKKVLFGTFYIPPNSNNAVWANVEMSFDMALNDASIDYIVVTGDFNDNQLNKVNSKVSSLLTQFSLTQVIDEPTHFTEQSSSLLDIIVTNDVNSIVYSGVGSPLLDKTRFHCPVIGFLNSSKLQQKSSRRKIWLYDCGDYDKFRHELSLVDWDSFLLSQDVNEISTRITSAVINAAELSIPNKIITVRKSEPPWMNNIVRRLIRKKNRIHRKAKRYNNASTWTKFRRIRNDVTSLIRKTKDDFNDNLVSKLSNSNSTGRDWWNTVKQLTSIKSCRPGIPPLVKNDCLIFDDTEKANEFNNFFAAQANLDDFGIDLPNLNANNSIPQLSEITITENEVANILAIINPSKASGPDLVNPRLLKEASDILKRPLCKLFNISLETGNEHIHILSSNGRHKIRFQLGNTNGTIKYADYSTFGIGDENSKYILSLNGYSGTAGDSLLNVKNAGRAASQRFTTFDNDNDKHTLGNCAEIEKGGWWYNACDVADLNQLYDEIEWRYDMGQLTESMIMISKAT
ncbi:unnamed protein product [Mytilus coruscus]|uniref:Fibrinogen C-terminal domain-containing protein n=1 Tax=Mytilus coruscus TaxID=42192 RepID=A0A6J8CKH8_MYTCO|nr:unnamed protein product [Mytilus coruscus]